MTLSPRWTDRLAMLVTRPTVSRVARAASRVLRHGTLPQFAEIEENVRGRKGLEIGGPSTIFGRRHLLPIYPIVSALDGANFGHDTVWEGRLEANQPYRFDRSHAPGRQFIANATDLSFAMNESYEFVASSHCLEHVANPLKALREWTRVIKQGGTLLLVVPDPHLNFDHRRPLTTMSHLVEDFERNVGEDDLTHLDEILSHHDLARDPLAGDAAKFRARSFENLHNRCLHHHVFSPALATEVVKWAGLDHVFTACADEMHIVVLAKKS